MQWLRVTSHLSDFRIGFTAEAQWGKAAIGT
jgi:hypothetical protein